MYITITNVSAKEKNITKKKEKNTDRFELCLSDL